MQATRLGDTDTGHDACPGTVLVSASTNVIINGKGAGRVGDSYSPHGCIGIHRIRHISSAVVVRLSLMVWLQLGLGTQ